MCAPPPGPLRPSASQLYNEDEELFSGLLRTMHGVAKHIAHLWFFCSRMQAQFGDKNVESQIYECTAQGLPAFLRLHLMLQSASRLTSKYRAPKGSCRCRSSSASKGKQNHNSINSQQWFFNDFGPVLHASLIDLSTPLNKLTSRLHSRTSVSYSM